MGLINPPPGGGAGGGITLIYATENGGDGTDPTDALDQTISNADITPAQIQQTQAITSAAAASNAAAATALQSANEVTSQALNSLDALRAAGATLTDAQQNLYDTLSNLDQTSSSYSSDVLNAYNSFTSAGGNFTATVTTTVTSNSTPSAIDSAVSQGLVTVVSTAPQTTSTAASINLGLGASLVNSSASVATQLQSVATDVAANPSITNSTNPSDSTFSSTTLNNGVLTLGAVTTTSTTLTNNSASQLVVGNLSNTPTTNTGPSENNAVISAGAQAGTGNLVTLGQFNITSTQLTDPNTLLISGPGSQGAAVTSTLGPNPENGVVLMNPFGVQGSQTTGTQGAQGIVVGAQGVQDVSRLTSSQVNELLDAIMPAYYVVGSQGGQGAQGVQGAQGGNQGVQGAQGEIVYMDPYGVQGSQGSQGSQGVQGIIVGPQGVQGIGFQGSQGEGFQGYQGNQGGGVVLIKPPNTNPITITNLTILNITPTIVTLSPTQLPGGVVGNAYSQQLVANGGTGPYTFSIQSLPLGPNTTLPAGLTITSGGLISGTPTAVTPSPQTVIIQAVDSNGAIGTKTYTINILASTRSPYTPPSVPTLPTPTPDNNAFRYIRGISVIDASATDIINNKPDRDYNVLGAVLVSAANQYLSVNVQDFLGNNLPNYTTFTLYGTINGTNMALCSAYSIGDKSSLTLYYQPSADTVTGNDIVVTARVSTTEQTSARWLPIVLLSAYGTARISEGSIHGYIYGPAAEPTHNGNGMALYAGGQANNTYIRWSEFLSTAYLTAGGIYPYTSDKYTFRVEGQSYQNPIYGVLASAAPVTSYGSEMVYGAINTNTLSSDYGKRVIDGIMQFEVVLDPLIQSPTPLKLYTPYTFALTGQSVWIQTVPPYYLTPDGYSSYSIDWGDGSPVKTYNNTNPTGIVYFTYAYTRADDTPYTVTVSAYDNSGNFQQATQLSARFYIQPSFPEISLDEYSKSLGTTPVLPYQLKDVTIGSNEWATSDNINAAFQKLENNFDYLNSITRSIRKTPKFELVEWLGDLCQYPTWNTTLPGSNTYTNLSSNYTGVVPGYQENLFRNSSTGLIYGLQDFKSYKSPYTAPDYYNYITYTSPSNFSAVQIRKNDFVNTQVLTLSSVVPGAQDFTVFSVDVSGSSLYVLASQLGGTKNYTQQVAASPSLYRFDLDYTTGHAYVVNKIGGSPGLITDPYNFGGNALATGFATEVKTYNNNVYVADKGNGCIKIYNASLTHLATASSPIAYQFIWNVFDIDQSTGNIFFLGTTKSPNTPVLTSVTTQLSGSGYQYAVTWNHDSLRLSPYYNFRLSAAEVNSNIYSSIVTLSSNFNNAESSPYLTEYIFTSNIQYDKFAVQAIGQYSPVYINNEYVYFDSPASTSTIVPNQNAFASPFAVFVFSLDNTTNYAIKVPEISPTAKIVKILVEPTGVFFYVITDSYVYKYTTTGLFVNRISDPSVDSLNEPIVNAFIDDRSYIYIVTPSRVFKYIDIPDTASLFDYEAISPYYTRLSAYGIGPNEMIQSWVYNRAIDKIINNHEILAKSINSKYVTVVDNTNNLVSFTTRALSGNEIITSLSADESNYIHSNELVSTSVVNRAIEKIFDLQTVLVSAIAPEVHVLTPNYTSNVLGKVTAAASVITPIYEYIQPGPAITQQPSAVNIYAGQDATFTFGVSSVGILTYQWYYNNTAIPSATSATYTILSAMLTDAGTYDCIATDNNNNYVASSAVNLGVELATLFSFASAKYVGGLYSGIYGGFTTRYGNDYTAVFEVLNVPLSASLLITLQETVGATPWNFTSPIYLTLTKDASIVYSTVTSVSASIAVPLSSCLTTPSNITASDGYPNTYSGKFTLALDIGASSSSVCVPMVTVKPSIGVMYSSSFTNSISAQNFNSTSMSIYSVSGVIPYTAITNNSLGGYLMTNPHLTHNWSVDNVVNNNTSPLYSTPVNPISTTLSATRVTTGETEVTLVYDRAIGTAPSVPYYNIGGYTNVKAKGNGFVLGSGNYKAGSLITMRAVGTYLDAYGDTPGQSTNSPLRIEGAGVWDAGQYTSFSSGALINLGRDPDSSSTSIMQIYVDGNKNVYATFYA